MYLPAEAAAVDEHQSLTALRELVGHLHRHAAPERLPDECRPVVTERIQQVPQDVGVGAERVLAAGPPRARRGRAGPERRP